MLHVLPSEMVSCERSGKGIRNICPSDPKEGIPMANPLHLALLSEGTETWNSWIHSHPDVVVDFSEAQLEHLNFDHAHLIGANFIGANLSHATFQGADLSGAILCHALLTNANLRDANLSGADLSEACLMGVDLMGADLREAFLRGTFFQGGHFSKAIFRWCDLQATDLGDVNVRAAIFV